MGHPFYATSSYVHHIVAIGESKPNNKKKSYSPETIPLKIGDFLSRATLKFDGCPWKIMGRLS